MRSGRFLGFLSAVIVAAFLATTLSAWQFEFGRRGRGRLQQPGPVTAAQTEYSFTRLVYNSMSYGGYRFWSWATDYPKADRQFVMGVKRLSLIESADEPVAVTWDDPRLFQYPILYAVEVGYMSLEPRHAELLREYLVRGGFLIVDDFHGPYEWARFENEIRKVFPDRPIVDVELSDSIYHCFYDINEVMQVPGVHYVETGSTSEKGGVTPHYRGIYDDKGRLMVIINYNMDLGDAWEWADLPEYPEKFSSQAYRLGINYIIYSMTH